MNRVIVVFVVLAAVLAGAGRASAGNVVGPIADLTTSCSGQNAEVESAADPLVGYVYDVWMGCSGIAFSRSTDRGLTWSKPVVVPGSVGSTYNSWDPAITVAPDGTVYVAFMLGHSSQWFPVVVASFNRGQTFPQVTQLVPPDEKNWGDREFLAVGPDGAVYLTYDYGPNRTSVTFLCAPDGSCGYATGDVNVVMQKSTNHGKTFGAMTYVSPGFPASGGDSGPLVVEPNGRIDVLFQDYPITDTTTYAMAPGIEEFTSSSDGGATWSRPVQVGAGSGTMSLDEWWIDGDIAIDAGGNLYATWDTQGSGNDIGWLSYSTDHGRHWSKPLQGPLDQTAGPHVMQVVGGAAGTAYAGWLTHANLPGYAMFLRPFSIASGWTAAPQQISVEYGDTSVWPGDTFGFAALTPSELVLSWGSATPSVGNKKSDIFAAHVFVH